MASRDRLVEQLKEVTLFSACSRGDLKIVARHTARVEVPPKTAIVSQGERGDSFYVLMEGEAAVRRKSGRTNRKVATLGPGGYFGELALLDPAPRNATVEAVSPCTLAVVDARVFRALVRDVPAMSEKLLAGMARRLREADLTVG
jgi:CRP/FNR family transcriptional regulator, cyclic AMP receptor protein